jgi:hypothetical protein
MERGVEHKTDCVMRKRTVMVRFTVDLAMEYPEDFDAQAIEFNWNQGSLCADNLIDRMQDATDRMEEHSQTHGCLCRFVEAKFLREATKDDEEAFGLHINGKPDENPQEIKGG